MDSDPRSRRARAHRDGAERRHDGGERDGPDPFSSPAPQDDSRGQRAPRAGPSEHASAQSPAQAHGHHERHVDPHITTRRQMQRLVHERMRQQLGPGPLPPDVQIAEPLSTAPSTVPSPSSHSRMSYSRSAFDSQAQSPMSSSDGTSAHFHSSSQSLSQTNSRRSSTHTFSHAQFPFSSHRHSRNSSLSTPPSGSLVASSQSFSADSTPYASQYAMLASQLAQHGKHLVRLPHSHNQPKRALTEVDLQPVRRVSISRGRLVPLAPRHAHGHGHPHGQPHGHAHGRTHGHGHGPPSGALVASSVLGIGVGVGSGLKSSLEHKHERDMAPVFSARQLPVSMIADDEPIGHQDLGSVDAIRPVALPPSRARAHQPPATVGPLDVDSEPESAGLDLRSLRRALQSGSPASASDLMMRAYDPACFSPIPPASDPRLWSPLSSSSSAATSCLSPPPLAHRQLPLAQDPLSGGMSPNQWGRLLTSYRNNTSSHSSRSEQDSAGGGGHPEHDTDTDPGLPGDRT